MRYRSKAVEIDAIRWTGDNYEDIVAFIVMYTHPLKGDTRIRDLAEVDPTKKILPCG